MFTYFVYNEFSIFHYIKMVYRFQYFYHIYIPIIFLKRRILLVQMIITGTVNLQILVYRKLCIKTFKFPCEMNRSNIHALHACKCLIIKWQMWEEKRKVMFMFTLQSVYIIVITLGLFFLHKLYASRYIFTYTFYIQFYLNVCPSYL